MNRMSSFEFVVQKFGGDRVLEFGHGDVLFGGRNVNFATDAQALETNPDVMAGVMRQYVSRNLIGRLIFPNIYSNTFTYKIPDGDRDSLMDARALMARSGTDAQPNILTPSLSLSAKVLRPRWLAAAPDMFTDEHIDNASLKNKYSSNSAMMQFLQNLYNMAFEMDVRDLVQNASAYDSANKLTCNGTSGYYYWDDTSNGDPLEHVRAMIDAMRSKGFTATHLVAGTQVIRALCKHPKVMGTDNKELSRADLLERLSGDGIEQILTPRSNLYRKSTDDFTTTWEENFAWLGVVNNSTNLTMDNPEPSFGYGVEKRGYPKTKTVIEQYTDRPVTVVSECLTAEVFDYNAGALISTPLNPS